MAQHPLEPLTEDEFRLAATVLRRDQELEDTWRFASIELQEPPKREVRAWTPGDPGPRLAHAVLWNRADNQAWDGLVDLTAEKVASWTHLPGVTPNYTNDETIEVDAAMRAHPDVVAALAQRGIADMSLVMIEVWTYGRAVMPERWRDRRLGWCDVWYRETPEGNVYGHPVSGLKLVVDLNTLELLDLENDHDHGQPAVNAEYVPGPWTGEQRTDLKPLLVTQPEGPSFTVDGTELRWQNWSMRLGFNYREGPVIYQVTYDDHGTVRDIAYRLSLAEMIVPYRDSSEDHYRRTAFDIGEWGLGFMTTSLELGCDCLGEIRYLDAVLHNSKGEPYTITNAVCIHEEDNAVLWKHVDHDAGAEVRRMRRLTISFHVTVANYEYLVYWRFYQDGNIECEIRATGIMVTTPVAEGQPHPNGTLVDERTYAPFHQHFLVARLDMDVDGGDNTVFMSESYAEPMGPDNPYGLSVVLRNVPLRTESEGKQDVNFATQRSWKVVNTNVVNGLGTNPSYKLVPSGAIPMMFDPASPVFQRASVIGHTLWVTPNSPDERWPAGEFVNQSSKDTGLAEWTKADRNIENTDVVLWYVFGIHHVTRPEDWPVMPVDVVSFWLKPYGFSDRNPALDVVGTPPDTCHTDSTSAGH